MIINATILQANSSLADFCKSQYISIYVTVVSNSAFIFPKYFSQNKKKERKGNDHFRCGWWQLKNFTAWFFTIWLFGLIAGC